MNEQPKTTRDGKGSKPRRVRWITIAAVLAYGGLAVMFASLFLPATDTVSLIGMGMFLTAALPYALALHQSVSQLTDSEREAAAYAANDPWGRSFRPIPKTVNRVEGCNCGGINLHRVGCTLEDLDHEQALANIDAANERSIEFCNELNRIQRSVMP